MSRDEEFFETYSDDLISLFEGRLALLTHPLRNEVEELVTASYARLLIVFVYGALEVLIRETLPDGVGTKCLDGRLENAERIRMLGQAFQQLDVSVSKNVLRDLLVLKYLRNVVVHSRWKAHEKKLAIARGFPADLRQLRKEHWLRILGTYDAMIRAIFGAKHRLPLKIGAMMGEELAKFDVDDSGLLRTGDIISVLRTMLDRIAETVSDYIFSDEVRSRVGRSESWPDNPPTTHYEVKNLFLQTAYDMSACGEKFLQKHAGLGAEAIMGWRMLRAAVLSDQEVDRSDIVRANAVLTVIHESELYPPVWGDALLGMLRMPSGRELLAKEWDRPEEISMEAFVQAMNIGRGAYETIGSSIGPSILLLVYLPIVDPAKSKEYVSEGSFALEAFTLGKRWIAAVQRKAPNFGENMPICEAFLQRLSPPAKSH